MVSSSLFLLALSGAASAIDFGDWVQHTGLTTTYNSLIKSHAEFISQIEAMKNNVTIFIPTNDAFDRWTANSSISDLSYTAQLDLLQYMVVNGSYTVKELYNVPSLPSLLGPKIKFSTSGLGTDVNVIASSGTNFTTNATVGVVNPDFPTDSGYIQLVSTVFQLPSDIEDKANKNTTIPSSATKNTIGAISALSVVGLGLMAML